MTEFPPFVIGMAHCPKKKGAPMRLKLIVFLAVLLALPAFGQTPQPAIPFASGELQIFQAPGGSLWCAEKAAKVITVPTGKYLMLEQFTYLDLELALNRPDGRNDYWAVTATTNGKVVTHFMKGIYQNNGASAVYNEVDSIPLHIYADPGTTVTVSIYYYNNGSCFRKDTLTNSPMNWSLSGRLVSSIDGD
jgi:hypothetical protein